MSALKCACSKSIQAKMGERIGKTKIPRRTGMRVHNAFP